MVLVFALFDGIAVLMRLGLLGSGLPSEEIERIDLFRFVFANGLALFLSLWFIYGPWFAGISRHDFNRIMAVVVLQGLCALPFAWAGVTVIKGGTEVRAARAVLGIYVGLFLVAGIVRAVRGRPLSSGDRADKPK
jgi:hypothetical protein